MADSQAPIVIGSAGLLSAIGGIVGPLAAEWSIVLLAAVIGAAAAASEIETRTTSGVWWVMARGVALALLFAAAGATATAKLLGVPPSELLIPVAGLIAWRQERVLALVAKLLPIKKGAP